MCATAEEEDMTVSSKDDSTMKPLHIDHRVLFTFAVTVLVGVLVGGLLKDDLKYNPIYLIALALSCSIVFAFIPFTAEADLRGRRQLS
jgi:Trk-type K+ transport system membrane component